MDASPKKPNALRAWRTTRLGAMKQTPEYQALKPILRQVVDHCVRRYESPDLGIIVSQRRLAARFGVRREAMSRYLCAIVAAGVFTLERRPRRGVGAGRGRSTNRYRLNEDLLLDSATCAHIETHIGPHIETHSGSTSNEVHVEAPTEHMEARSSREHVEGKRDSAAPPKGSPATYDAGLQTPASVGTSETHPIASNDYDDARREWRLAFRERYGREPTEDDRPEHMSAWDFRHEAERLHAAASVPW